MALKKLFMSGVARNLRSHYKKFFKSEFSEKKLVVIECIEDLYYFGLFAQIAITLQNLHQVQFQQIIIRSVNVGESKNLFCFLKYRFLNGVISMKWVSLYKVFCSRVAFRSSGNFCFLLRPKALCQSFSIWRNLRKKSELIELSMDGIIVGDLINDTYLRFKPSPTVNLKDLYLLYIIYQAKVDVIKAVRYFSKVAPKLLLASYSTYIQHGIPVRAALLCGVQVYTAGNYLQFLKKLSREDSSHVKTGYQYGSIFSLLQSPNEKLCLAEGAIKARLSGEIDVGNSYMRRSSYALATHNVPDVKGAVVIFLHDFFDSPHVYRSILFPDFYEWITFTLKILSEEGILFFVKPHPNQGDLSKSVLERLALNFPSMKILPSDITNVQLVDGEIIAAITVYGSVAHEMAYLGVPTIACGDNPHVAFNFCATPAYLCEYRELLKNVKAIPVDKEAMKNESLKFYYMHNQFLGEEERGLMSSLLVLRKLCDSPRVSGIELLDQLAKISSLPIFVKKIVAIRI